MNNQYLNTIIRASLSAASAALTMIEQQETAAAITQAKPAVIETGACAAVMSTCDQWAPAVEAAMVDTPVVLETPKVDVRTPFAKLMDELEDPRYTLRSFAELSVKSGIPVDEIEPELDDNGVEYVTRVRRRDGVSLIGLESRN